jgi:signal transduction histidine kinase
MANILIVDDNPQNLYLLETILRVNSYKVISARNGADALAIAREIPPDLIITDILMPIMDGFELCRLWRADEQLKHVPFIFYTATYTEPKDEQLALGLGADRFIIKPQQPEVLAKVVHDILDEYSMGMIIPKEQPLGEEMEILRRYNAVLFHKLETKMLQLEREIIERKNAQDSLVRLNSELEARVEERTVELKDALKKMLQQEKLVVIGKLARNLSHELRNPLGVISNSIYFLTMRLPTADEKIKKHLAIIQDQSTRATKIISNLLEVTRLKPRDCRKTDLHTLIKETLDLIPAPENVVVRTCFTENLPNLFIDPTTIQQAFLNIITNAFQAMVNGGELEITTSLHGNMIDVAFKDLGVGIPKENLPRLFEPLFSTKVNGIGLSLAIVKEIIESINGSIGVDSVVGKGSTFTIRIPVLQGNNLESK